MWLPTNYRGAKHCTKLEFIPSALRNCCQWPLPGKALFFARKCCIVEELNCINSLCLRSECIYMHRHQLDPRISASIVFVCALFMSIMDGTIVNVALPTLGRQLNVPSTSIDAVVVAYLVSLAVIIPVSGWLGDRWGTKRTFLLALALFSTASALCGISTNFAMLVGFRVLQGLAGGALTPVGTAILYRTFPPAE